MTVRTRAGQHRRCGLRRDHHITGVRHCAVREALPISEIATPARSEERGHRDDRPHAHGEHDADRVAEILWGLVILVGVSLLLTAAFFTVVAALWLPWTWA